MGDTTTDRYSGDEPHFRDPEVMKGCSGRLACEPCGSEDTEVVHIQAQGSIIGYSSEVEVRCRACGKYSALVTEYDS